MRTVFTNGVFDLLHAGHVQFLAAACELGDRLIVGVDTDASARALGKSHPLINPQQSRIAVVRGLRSVDSALLFTDLPLLLQQLKPAIYVKGGDYTAAALAPIADLIAPWGGAVRILPYAAGYSTTSLIERIRA